MFQVGLFGVIDSLGTVSKVVLLILFIFSVVSWAIIFFKWRTFRSADQEDQKFMGLLAKAGDLDDLCRHIPRMDASPAAVLFEGLMDRVTRLRTKMRLLLDRENGRSSNARRRTCLIARSPNLNPIFHSWLLPVTSRPSLA
jgi:biopolymer transport protein ExbB/TolQ